MINEHEHFNVRIELSFGAGRFHEEKVFARQKKEKIKG